MEASYPILVVDDDIVSRKLVERYLTKAGFEVCTAGNGREALPILDQCGARIVLTDWMMPEIDGPELCRLIRKKATDSYIFIILITARGDKTDIVSGLGAGADDYLTKPIHAEELVARIKTGVRILKLEQSLRDANEEIRLLSITDPLTGCYNRGYLNERFPLEFRRSKRYRHPLSILMTDIDHFKHINDNYGHQTGDLVLKRFAECIRGQVRHDIDWVVRYGGEEFLIILPETGSQGLSSVAERIRKSIEELSIETDANLIRITASFGGAHLAFNDSDATSATMERMVNIADIQLYHSKNEGRNRVNIAPGS